MQDIITLRGLSALGTHGVYEFEQRDPQPFTVDVSLWVDTAQATRDDDLEYTVSYAQVATDVIEIIEGPSVRLIETLAQHIAAKLMAYPRVDGVEVTVHKPQAPLDVDFTDVTVTARRGQCDLSLTPHVEPDLCSSPSAAQEQPARSLLHSVPFVEAQPGSAAPMLRPAHVEPEPCLPTPFVLAFGGNQGNVPVTLVQALEILMDLPEVQITEISPLIRTEAVVKPGAPAQDDHWNMVVLGTTTVSPDQLLDLTSHIEERLGRERPYEWAPRTIDIDIICVGDHVIDDARLQLPHPRAYGRAFVLLPWLLADPKAELRGYGFVAALLADAPDQSGVRDIIDDWYLRPETVMADSDALLLADIADAPTQPDEASGDEEHPLPEKESPAEEPSSANPAAVELAEAPAAHFAPNVAEAASSLPAGRNFAAEWDNFIKTVDFDAQTEEPAAPEMQMPSASFQAESVALPAVEESTPASVGYQAPSFDRALEEEQKIEQVPHISWIPVSKTTPIMTDDTGENPVIDPAPGEANTEHFARPLPSWNFSQTPVTIIDSFEDEDNSAEAPSHDITLAPDLPEDAEVGVVEEPTLEPVALSRRNVLRPTHTGAVPVSKRSR